LFVINSRRYSHFDFADEWAHADKRLVKRGLRTLRGSDHNIYDYWYVENQWKLGIGTAQNFPYATVYGAFAHLQKVDDMDAAAWERIDRQRLRVEA